MMVTKKLKSNEVKLKSFIEWCLYGQYKLWFNFININIWNYIDGNNYFTVSV